MLKAHDVPGPSGIQACELTLSCQSGKLALVWEANVVEFKELKTERQK